MVAACAVALSQAAPVASVAQRMDAMVLSTTRIDDPASGRVYPFLDCRDAVALLNPDAIRALPANGAQPLLPPRAGPAAASQPALPAVAPPSPVRSEEHTSELQSLMRISTSVFGLKKENTHS